MRSMIVRHIEVASLAPRHLGTMESFPFAARSPLQCDGFQRRAQALPVRTRSFHESGAVAMSRSCRSSLTRSFGDVDRGDRGPRCVTTRSLSLPVTAASLTEPTTQTTEWVPFVLTPDSIEEGCRQTGLAQTRYLTSLLKQFTALARPPISNFRVAAIGVGASGHAYAGVNLEIPGVPLHNSVHAEQFVVANAMQHGETRIQQMLVNHPPCGHCRQVNRKSDLSRSRHALLLSPSTCFLPARRSSQRKG